MTPTATDKPVLFVTGHAPRDRVGAFACLHEREHVEFALFGGRAQHGFAADAAEPLPSSAKPGGEAAPSGHIPRPPSGHIPRHGSATDRDELPFPHRHVEQREILGLASSGRYRAVVCSTGGRVALPAAWAGARRARVPVILWASLWAHPRSAAHLASYPILRRLYRSANAVVTYGPHVSAYVSARGARNVYVAPQSVDNAFWRAPASEPPASLPWPDGAHVKFLFAGRPSRAKGVGVLFGAWRDSGLSATPAALVLVGVGPAPPWAPADGAVRCKRLGGVRRERLGAVRREFGMPLDSPVPTQSMRGEPPVQMCGEPQAQPHDRPICLPPVDARRLRALYDAADVLVVPSIPTRTFREPWGLVINEAMNRELPVIASDAVGAAAGGLVRDGHNGLVVPAGDVDALANAMRRLAGDAALRVRLGAAGGRDVLAYSHDAWAAGFSGALAGLGLSRGGRW